MPPFRHGSAHDVHEVLYVLTQPSFHGRTTQAATSKSIPQLFRVDTIPPIPFFRISKGTANGIMPVILASLFHGFFKIHPPPGWSRNMVDPID